MRKTKGFSYDPAEDMDVIEHLDKQQNFSTYLKELVRKDMKGSDIVEIINQQIEKYLSRINYEKVDNAKDITVNERLIVGISSNDIQSILNL